jgi:hypothetical protein
MVGRIPREVGRTDLFGVRPVLGEVARTALSTMAERLPNFGVSSRSACNLIPDQMCCGLKVRREFDALSETYVVWLFRGHRPGVPALGATTHPWTTLATPPANPCHR